MKKLWIGAACAAALSLAGGIALAGMDDENPMSRHMPMMQHMAQGMHGGGMHGMHGGSPGAGRRGDQSPSTLAFIGVNAKMHQGMDIEFSGNADADFVRGMIPHHEGAVDMAKIVLAFGKDPEVRKLAEAIVKAQEDEITWMKGWLDRKGR